ncbi:hypothetical protein O6H91_10G008800 [Diphasiastrum complanatum]|uniref:Uncharacterized protein n=1 Tax=Diphasiastrum complanatum TaxID=34168 RepID=A0ACC2CF53_DIPCM|nr:hypothetical protein O6H91_10G008800 [Diphasiastrum complanatum]
MCFGILDVYSNTLKLRQYHVQASDFKTQALNLHERLRNQEEDNKMLRERNAQYFEQITQLQQEAYAARTAKDSYEYEKELQQLNGITVGGPVRVDNTGLKEWTKNILRTKVADKLEQCVEEQGSLRKRNLQLEKELAQRQGILPFLGRCDCWL